MRVPNYTDFAVRAFRGYLCMVREIVFGVGFALLLPVFYGLDGVLYSMPVSDVLTFVISVIVIVLTYRQLDGR